MDEAHRDATRPLVRVFHAQNCHLCDRALSTLAALGEQADFDLETVDIGGDPDLEARYRARIPVVEIDGEEAFTYFVHPDGLRRRLARG